MEKAPSQVSRPQVFQPKKQLGQHFLRSKSVLNKIIEAADLKNTDLVLEIGPGLGILTEKLAEKAGRVVAVEKDSRLIPLLKEKFAKTNNVEIIQGDILEILSAKCKAQSAKLQLKTQSYKVVANLPYYAATHIVRRFLELKNQPELMVLMLQKEVAQRICACPPKMTRSTNSGSSRAGRGMSLLAVSVQFYAQVKIISYVSKNAFWPKPKVDSAIIKIEPLIYADKRLIYADRFFKIAKAGFSQPRKQLLNNLSKVLKLSKEKVKVWLLKNNLEPKLRAESLTLDNWLALTKTFTP